MKCRSRFTCFHRKPTTSSPAFSLGDFGEGGLLNGQWKWTFLFLSNVCLSGKEKLMLISHLQYLLGCIHRTCYPAVFLGNSSHNSESSFSEDNSCLLLVMLQKDITIKIPSEIRLHIKYIIQNQVFWILTSTLNFAQHARLLLELPPGEFP